MASRSEAVEQLCLGCGLCCDGSLFSNAVLEKDETPLVGPTRQGANGTLLFDLPCRCFNGKCSIYTARPKTCIGFYCDTAKLVKSGLLGQARGQARVDKMRAHIAGLRKMTGDYETSMPTLSRRVIDEFKAGLKDLTCTVGDQKTARVAYRYRALKVRYFASPFKRRLRKVYRAVAKILPQRAKSDQRVPDPR